MFDELDAAKEHLYPAEQEQAPINVQSAQQEQSVQQNTDHELSKQASMRVLRERAESAERRALELERMVQMNMSQQQTTKMQVVDEDDDIDISDDTYIEGKHLKKYVKNLKQELKNTKRQFEEYNQQNALAQAEMRLKNQFNDFDTVVTQDNLKKLEQQKPALYRTILSNPDVYDKGYAAYEFIKHSGVLDDQYQELDKKVEENRMKPRSAAT